MKRITLLFATSLALGLALAGCADDDDPVASSPPEPTYSWIQANVFNARCTGCHDTTSPPEGLSLVNAYPNIVNVPSSQQPGVDRIEPGLPDSSYLIRKVEGDPSITGVRMPAIGAALSTATIDAMRQWVTDGALNN